jgi:hypothetical protein
MSRLTKFGAFLKDPYNRRFINRGKQYTGKYIPELATSFPASPLISVFIHSVEG